MKRFIIILLLSIFLCITYTTQAQLYKPTIYVEGLGAGLLHSINYDARFVKGNPFGIRLGFSTYQESPLSKWQVVPLQINYIIKMDAVQGVEIAFGVHLQYSNGDYEQIRYTPAFMYRYQGPKGLNFRIGLSPVLDPKDSNFVWGLTKIWPGMSVGYKF